MLPVYFPSFVLAATLFLLTSYFLLYHDFDEIFFVNIVSIYALLVKMASLCVACGFTEAEKGAKYRYVIFFVFRYSYVVHKMDVLKM